MMKDVSCILINYNTTDYTLACIRSIIENTGNSILYEIIIVDNASHEEEFLRLQTEIEQQANDFVKLVRSKQNLGFGGGNMLGVQHASRCLFYAFINNDTLLHTAETLSKLTQFMQENEGVGICSPQMLNEHGQFRKTIDHFSSLQREILRRPTLEFLFPKIYLNRKKTYSNPTKVHYVQGAFLFTRATDFNKVGGFDTHLFLYYEESDLSLRLLRKLNKSTYLYPDASYIHFQSKSTSKGIAIKIEQKISLLYHTQKHYGWLARKILITYFIIRYAFTSLLKPKYWKLVKVLLRGAPLYCSLKQQQPLNAQ